MQLYIAAFELFRDNRVCKTQSGKSGCLGKAAKLNGTGFCPLYFKNTMGDILVLNKCLIGGIKQNDPAAFPGVVHPLLQLLPGIYRACGVVGVGQDQRLRLGGDRLFQRSGLLAAGGDLPFPAGFPPRGGNAPGGGWRYDRRGDGGP